MRNTFTMKKLITFVTGVIVLCASCVSMQDREMSWNEKAQAQVLGQVSVEFHSYQFFHIPSKNRIKTKVYNMLMKEAQQQYAEHLQYGGTIEIRNIIITGGWSDWEWLNGFFNVGVAATGGSYSVVAAAVGAPQLLSFGIPLLVIGIAAGNTQKITAIGDVVLLGGGAGTPIASRGMEEALNKAAAVLIESMPEGVTIAVLSVYSADSGIADYVIDALEYRFFNARKFNLVDRRRLEQIRLEQNFQMSGEVSDSSAVSIGNMLGAGIVITGSVSGSGASRRLTLRALDVSTARIVTMAMEVF